MSETLLPAIANRELWLVLACVTLAALLTRDRIRARRHRRTLEQEARLLTGRLTDMGKRTNDIMLLLAGDGRILDANDRAVEAYGYTLDELLAMNVRSLRAPEVRAAVDADMVAAAQTGSARVETLHVRKDGSTFPVEASARVVSDDGPLMFQDVVRDISDRKRAELALRVNEERLRAIMSGARDAIVVIDNGGLVTFWNRAAEDLFGYGPEEVMGRDLHDFITPEPFRPAQRAAFPVWRQTGAGAAIGKTLELPARRKDGTERIIELSLSSVQGADGWNAVAIARDVSARKLAELELRKAKEAAEITRTELLLANARLETSMKTAHEMAEQARAASTAKGDFLARMSHEIRTPMNAIIGMTGLLLDTGLNEEQHDYADTVRRSADALLGIINDILDYSKIEAGRLELEQIGFDIREVVEDTIEVCAITAEQKGLGLSCLVADEVPVRVIGDPGRLRQVLLNLLGNALKFTERGDVALRVALAGADEGRVTLRFAVRDTGIGIAPSKLDRLFESFTQADSSITRRYGGTGLGLTISKRLVELMGGSVDVASVEGTGTTFGFTAVVRSCEEGRDLTTLPADLADTRVLVVDDSATNRFVLAEQLRSLNCRHDSAPDAASALAKLRAAMTTGDPFAVAILDSAMPDVDGVELAGQIRADASLASTRLALCSSWGTRLDADRLRAAGFSASLTKPLRRADLYRALVSIVRGAPGPSAPTVPFPVHTVLQGRSSPIRALVADDNAVNQKLAVRLLEKIGLRADAVASGREALEALSLGHYDVVFMDVQMPDMDGLDATRAIRRLEEGTERHVPVVAVTAHAMKGDRQRCLDAGMDDYVSKPVDRQSLVAAINRAFGDAPPTSAMGGAETSGVHPVFDRDRLTGYTEGDVDLMNEIIRLFLADTPGRLRDVAEAADQGTVEELARLAHTLKGAGRTVCALAFGEAAADLETASQQRDVGRARSLARALCHEFARAEPILVAETRAVA